MTIQDGLAIDIGTFSSKDSLDGRTIHLVLDGEADAAAVPALDLLLKRLEARAAEVKPEAVVLDFRQVSFMNSSCFTKLIAYVERVRSATADARYKIRLRSNQEILWQRRSLHALQCFAVDLITLES